MASSPAPSPPYLARIVEASYRHIFLDGVKRGELMPLTIPYTLLGPFIVPLLWLSIPHTTRPWLYAMRWPVMAFVAFFCWHIVQVTSSTNMAVSYGAGLIASWGIIMNLNLLVWTRPQWDAKRAMRRKRRGGGKEALVMQGGNGTAANFSAADGSEAARKRTTTHKLDLGSQKADSEFSQEEFEYYWQPFPKDAPFLARFIWMFDLATSFRGSGWNTAISSIPRPSPPPSNHDGEALVNISSIPRVSSSGYTVPLSEADLLRSKLVPITITYLVLDMLSTFMTKDPYFILGPDTPSPLVPYYIKDLNPWLLQAYREVVSLVAFLTAIIFLFNVSQIACYWVGERFWPDRNMLWLYSSSFGSFSKVFTHGLAGFWGTWWHQTFRTQFMAPAKWLLDNGYIRKNTQWGMAVPLFCSFLQSGLLHTPGPLTSMAETKPGRSMVFFVLQAVGIMIQTESSKWLLRRQVFASTPSLARQAANALFVIVWLYFTAIFFCDDVASSGLWLYEPVPISICRPLGLGHPDDHHWWRLDEGYFPVLYRGPRWWQSGIGL